MASQVGHKHLSTNITILQTRPIGLDTVETSVGFKVQKLLDSRWWLDDG